MIDEKKLIEERPEWLNPDCVGSEEYNKGWNDCNKYWCNTIKRQPKVGEWIPCSERLPEMHREDMEAEGEYYMISNPVIVTDGQQIYIAEYEADMDYRYGWHSLDGEDYDNIIAWMPLPEPYRPEKESE